MLSFRALASLALSFSLAPSALALTYGEAKSIAKSLPKQYLEGSDHGKLCEVLGVKIMQDLMPGATVMNGVSYRKRSLTIGELDLVVMKNNVVTDVIEVKCWSSYKKAANKADDQLERFSDYIGRCDVDFSLDGNKIPCNAFGNPNINLGKMSYKDAKSSGFDYDLNFTRKEILQLIKDARATYSVKEPVVSTPKPTVPVTNPAKEEVPATTATGSSDEAPKNSASKPVLVDDTEDMDDLLNWWNEFGSNQ